MSLNSEKENGAAIFMGDAFSEKRSFCRIKPEGRRGLLLRDELSFIEKAQRCTLKLLLVWIYFLKPLTKHSSNYWNLCECLIAQSHTDKRQKH